MTIIEKILTKLFKLQIIARNPGPGKPDYLWRWHLLTTRWGRIYLHRFMRPDEDPDPHDHPWDSWIFILKGGYREKVYYDGTNKFKWYETHKAFSFRKMPAPTVHMIQKLEAPRVWTLLFCSKKRRNWGFLTPEGWVYYRDYYTMHRLDLNGTPQKEAA